MRTQTQDAKTMDAPTQADIGIGEEMLRLIAELYLICRSITGNGVRQSLHILQKHIPLVLHEVPSGTEVFDWTVPREWNIRDAWIKNSHGDKIVDFQNSNLHVLNYSVPVHRKVSLEELKQHLFSIPDHPDWVPYRTSYYKESWGFCLPHKQLLSLQEDQYEVCIDSSLEPGHLTYGELFIPGRTPEDVLISCHVCHPSLCNDNLSGIALAVSLAKELTKYSMKHSYRFLFIPGTIGSITWLSLNGRAVQRIKHGLVLTCVGDRGELTYKKSRRGDAEIDRAMSHTLKHSGQRWKEIDFSPYGYDERQFCSPGFDLPVGCLMRSQHGTFPEYHTSADNLDFVDAAALTESFSSCMNAFYVLEKNATYVNLNPKCEPQLGKRGLYRAMGGDSNPAEMELAMLWVLNLSDGEHSLLDIAERSGIRFARIKLAADALIDAGLLSDSGEAGEDIRI